MSASRHNPPAMRPRHTPQPAGQCPRTAHRRSRTARPACRRACPQAGGPARVAGQGRQARGRVRRSRCHSQPGVRARGRHHAGTDGSVARRRTRWRSERAAVAADPRPRAATAGHNPEARWPVGHAGAARPRSAPDPSRRETPAPCAWRAAYPPSGCPARGPARPG